MEGLLKITILTMLLTANILMANEVITIAHINEVITETDKASINRDVRTIGKYLSDNFSKDIEVPSEDKIAIIQINKNDYLEMITKGWGKTEEYSYKRENTKITIAADGLSGESRSTLTETAVVDGKKITSKIREYARYELQNGRPVITTIEGLTLAGDTTPKP